MKRLVALFITPFIMPLLLGLSLGYAQECEDGFRRFEHAGGATCVPETVERLVAFDLTTLETLLALNYAPVLRSNYLENALRAQYPSMANDLTALTGDLPDMGFPVNAEALVEAAPEVIEALDAWTRFLPEVVEQIAPLILVDADAPWQDNLRFITDLIGESEVAEALLADYNARTETLQAALPAMENTSVSPLRARPEETLAINSGNTFGLDILRSFGFTAPPKQVAALGVPGEGEIDFSRERWDLLDGDVVLVFASSPDPEALQQLQAFIDTLDTDPIFQTLSAAQRDAVYPVGGHWFGWGIVAAHYALDDIFRIFTDSDASEVAPNPFAGE